MSDLWERVKKTASDIYSTASERTVEGVNLGVKHLDVVSLRRDLSREFTGLGGRVYQLLRRDQAGDIPDDPTVLHHLRRLEELEERLEERESEIRRMREGKPAPAEGDSSEASTLPTEPTEPLREDAAFAEGPGRPAADAPPSGEDEPNAADPDRN